MNPLSLMHPFFVHDNAYVGVVLSGPDGLGWSTYAEHDWFARILALDGRIAKAVHEGVTIDREWWDRMMPGIEIDDLLIDNASSLSCEFVPLGTRFYIKASEYDFSETIVRDEPQLWHQV